MSGYVPGGGQSSGEPFSFADSPLSTPLRSFFAQGPSIYVGGLGPASFITTPGLAYEGHHDTSTAGGQQLSPPATGERVSGPIGRYGQVFGETYTTPAQYAPTQQIAGSADRDMPGPGNRIPAPNNGATKQSAEAVWQSWFHKTPAEIETLQKQLVALNYLSPGGFTVGRFDPKTQDAFGYVLMNVAQYNDPNVTVDKYLAAANTGPGGKAPTSQTTHSTSTSYTSSADAEGQYQQIAQQLLGHRATQTAAEAAYAALHGAEAANPSTTNTTTTYDALTGRQTGQSSVSSGGLGAAGSADLLQRQAYAAPDFGVYQAAGPLYNAMIAALAAPSQVGA